MIISYDIWVILHSQYGTPANVLTHYPWWQYDTLESIIIIGVSSGLAPIRCQAIAYANDDSFVNGTLRMNHDNI